MHHAALPLAILLLSAAAAHAAEVPQVYLSEGELNYIGYLDADANKRLFALYDSLEAKPTLLAIRSRGGDVNPGMELGKWVHAHKLDVKVMEFCMSSCANYVFTAGARKIVGSAAMIAYHGGVSSMSFIVGGNDKDKYAAMSQQQKDDYMANLRKTLAPVVATEAAFFKTIGVRQDITTYGQQARFKPIIDNGSTSGWTYSQEGFGRFGVERIEVLNPPWVPKLLTMRAGIARLDVD